MTSRQRLCSLSLLLFVLQINDVCECSSLYAGWKHFVHFLPETGLIVTQHAGLQHTGRRHISISQSVNTDIGFINKDLVLPLFCKVGPEASLEGGHSLLHVSSPHLTVWGDNRSLVLVDVAGAEGLPKSVLESLFQPPTSCVLEESSPYSPIAFYYPHLRAKGEVKTTTG